MYPEANYPEDSVKHQSPLSDASMVLADNISSLQDMVGVLEKRLASVLRPAPVTVSDTRTGSVRDISTSPHVADMEKHNARLHEIRDALGWLIERLDV